MDNDQTSAAFGQSAGAVPADKAAQQARQCIIDKNVAGFREIIKHIPQDGLSALLANAFRRVEISTENVHNYYNGIISGRIPRDKNKEGSLVVLREEAFFKFKMFADILMEAGAQIGWKNQNGENFLHRTARWGAADAIEWAVVEKKFIGIDEKTEGKSRYVSCTALHIACTEKNIDAALMLVDLDADFHALTPGGKKPGMLLRDATMEYEFYEACSRHIFNDGVMCDVPVRAAPAPVH